ncbi:MAG TPA: DUF4062 domain-containing protein [Candidatus Dormibacteraeota bacterium]|nr:DUF4062 domain-containing protein [Candidatus Dormibacteraeota bacterium]
MPGWRQRVFLSHTSELREFPRRGSFVAAAQAGAVRAEFIVSDMAYFAARDQEPAEYCRQAVQQADVYVGIIGFRYGSTVLDRPDTSYTELEFETATDHGLPRLVFILDEQSGLPLPAEQIRDIAHSSRQEAFRRRLQEAAGVTVVRVASPPELEARVYQALLELTARTAPPRRRSRTDREGRGVGIAFAGADGAHRLTQSSIGRKC